MKYQAEQIRQVARWTASDIRSMCVRQNLYTMGDCEAYDKMLSFVRDTNPTMENMVVVANDILEHSDVEKRCRMYGVDESGVFENILFEIGKCVTHFYELEGEAA